MKVAVFGANGYLGQHAVHYLMEKGWHVQAFDIHDAFKGEAGIPYHRIDITDKTGFAALATDTDQVYFFSGLTGTDVSIDKYEDYIRVNETGLLHLLQHIRDFGKMPKVIFPSTRLVYKGQQGKPLPEDAPKEFKTVYASSKYNGEMYLEMFRNLYGLDYTVFRVCVPYGNLVAGALSYGTVGFFLGRANKGEPISLFGDGSLKRTFTHVMDVCRQMVEVAQLPEAAGQCFNTAGETFSLMEAATMIGERYGVPVTCREWPQKAWQLESGDTIFDAAKLERLMPEPLTYSLQEWIRS